jgi:hypothetical protein
MVENSRTEKAGISMYDIEAIVTTATPPELKLTGNWPLDWLQVPNSIEIRRKLSRGEVWEPPPGPAQRMEIGGNRAFWPNLQVGDHVIVRCFLKGESR